eukprot:COSAG02_NODE_538_length_20609_cov_7.009703_10_plen_65_part_00
MHITDTDHGISAAREDAAEAAGTVRPPVHSTALYTALTAICCACSQVHSTAARKEAREVTLLQD